MNANFSIYLLKISEYKSSIIEMADRLTQLQDAINQQADNFTNSLGILQQTANPSHFTGFGNRPQPTQQHNEDHTHLFVQMIARTAKDIEVLIDSLPSEESSTELQSAGLKKLENENEQAAQKLENVIKEGTEVLEKIQSALHDIAQAQLEIQKVQALTGDITN